MQSRLSILALIFFATSSVTEADDSDLTSPRSRFKDSQDFSKNSSPYESKAKHVTSGEILSTKCTKFLPSDNSIELAAACVSMYSEYSHDLSLSSKTKIHAPVEKSMFTTQPTRMTAARSGTAKGALWTGTPSSATKTFAVTHPNSTNHTQETMTTMPLYLSEPSTSQPFSENGAYTTSAPTSASDNVATQPTGGLKAAGALAVGVVIGLAMLG